MDKMSPFAEIKILDRWNNYISKLSFSHSISTIFIFYNYIFSTLIMFQPIDNPNHLYYLYLIFTFSLILSSYPAKSRVESNVITTRYSYARNSDFGGLPVFRFRAIGPERHGI